MAFNKARIQHKTFGIRRRPFGVREEMGTALNTRHKGGGRHFERRASSRTHLSLCTRSRNPSSAHGTAGVLRSSEARALFLSVGCNGRPNKRHTGAASPPPRTPPVVAVLWEEEDVRTPLPRLSFAVPARVCVWVVWGRGKGRKQKNGLMKTK